MAVISIYPGDPRKENYMRIIAIIPTLALLNLVPACHQKADEMNKITTQKDFPAPPAAAVKPVVFQEFGNTRTDPYFWLRERDNPEVIDYLNAENAYVDAVLGSTKELRQKLYEEMLGRIKEDDSSVPVYHNGYYYYSRTEQGKQYTIYCRKQGSLEAPEEVLIDGNAMAEGKAAFIMGNYEISPDNRLMAYAFNYTGSYAEFTIKVVELATGRELVDQITSSGNFVWANDNRTLFYVIVNESLRPYRLYRHLLGANGPDQLVYEENDERFNLYVSRSKTDRYIMIASGSFTSSEYRILPADEPDATPVIFFPRQPDVEYHPEHHLERFYIHYKDDANKNYKVMEAPLQGFEDRTTWKDVIAHDPEVRVERVDVSEKYLSVLVRSQGLRQIRILDLSSGEVQPLSFPEPVYNLFPGYTPEYTSAMIRYTYTSLNRPSTTYDYNMADGTTIKLKEQEIPSGFNPDDYTVERHWATAPDGVKVPMALVYRKGLKKNGNNPAYLYSYGSYGSSTDANFRSSVFSLVDRGFVYAIAQIRGGSELGEQWYEDGKLLNKKNTFTDFIACAEHLIREKYTSPKYLAIEGGSAGGLLMGAVVNMRPELFQAVVADVPFVDVINTMLDSSLPLTTQEYEEWGNPNEQEYYEYILSYSPYDNITARAYPNILATTGFNDSQVSYHEPAKWVARLRQLKTGDNIVLLYTNMDSGHGGATGRYDYLKEMALSYAFILDRMGIRE